MEKRNGQPLLFYGVWVLTTSRNAKMLLAAERASFRKICFFDCLLPLPTLSSGLYFSLVIYYSICYNKPMEAVLLHICKQLSMTQEQIAHELNVGFSTVNRWKKGHTIPSCLAYECIEAFYIENNVDSEIVKAVR